MNFNFRVRPCKTVEQYVILLMFVFQCSGNKNGQNFPLILKWLIRDTPNYVSFGFERSPKVNGFI